MPTTPDPASSVSRVSPTALSIPLGFGLAIYGWRAAATGLVVSLAAAMTAFVLRRCGRRGLRITPATLTVPVLLTICLLPAGLAGGSGDDATPLWPLAFVSGVIVPLTRWAFGGRVRAVLAAIGLIVTAAVLGGYLDDLSPDRVLHPRHALIGDITVAGQVGQTLEPAPGPDRRADAVPWIDRRGEDRPDVPAISSPHVADLLTAYTVAARGTGTPAGDLDALLRDAMPPLEDLLLIGHPTPIGQASGVATGFASLYLLWRGTIRPAVPVVAITTAYLAWVVLPQPVAHAVGQTQWRWLVGSIDGVGWATGLTYVHYVLFAGPTLFVAILLAPLATIVPPSRASRVGYAVVVGVGSSALSTHVSAAYGPYLALAIAGLALGLVRRTRSGRAPAASTLPCPA